MRKLGYLFVIVAAVNFALQSNSKAWASSGSPKKEEAPPPRKKVEPSGLTGAKLPKCPEGEYVAGMMCKKPPPGYYLDYGMKYPAPCPKGTTSPVGSRSITYCK
jgi:hypothetical protein